MRWGHGDNLWTVIEDMVENRKGLALEVVRILARSPHSHIMYAVAIQELRLIDRSKTRGRSCEGCNTVDKSGS